MKNGQKYAKEINRMVNQEYFECSLWNIRNGKRASEDCRHIPESFDPVSGSDEFCKKCLCESLEWLNQEYKEPILDEAEKTYLREVIRPFRCYVKYISKETAFIENRCRIKIVVKQFVKKSYDGDLEEWIILPSFKGDMYKGMELGRKYTLEELGL